MAYQGRVKLFRVVYTGESETYAAVSEDDARARFEKRWAEDTDEVPTIDGVTELDADEVHEVGGDDAKECVPRGGRYDAVRNRVIATSAHFAAEYEPDGSAFPVFQSCD